LKNLNNHYFSSIISHRILIIAGQNQAQANRRIAPAAPSPPTNQE
jgi:hypothetical protein